MSLYDDEPAPSRLSAGQVGILVAVPVCLVACGVLFLLIGGDSEGQKIAAKAPAVEARPVMTSRREAATERPRTRGERQGETEEAAAAVSVPAVPPPVQPKQIAAPTIPQSRVESDPKSPLANHRWWKKQPTSTQLDRISDLICSHGEGYVFIDAQGNSVWVQAVTKGRSAPPFDEIHVQSMNANVHKTIGRPRVFVRINPSGKLRHTKEEAVLLLQDALNQPDSDKALLGDERTPIEQLFDGIRTPDESDSIRRAKELQEQQKKSSLKPAYVK